MKCSLCEGPIVDGRCKLCGMPYRRDEVLYHLNENRRDHYRHASDKARKIIEYQQPVKNHKTTEHQQPVKSRKVSEYQQPAMVRKEVEKKVQKAKVHKEFGTKHKKKSVKRRILTGIVIVCILPGLVEGIVETIQDSVMSRVEPVVYETEYKDRAIETERNRDDYFYESKEDDGYVFYALGAGYGTAEVGERIDPGRYHASASEDELVLVVENEHKEERYVLEEDGDMIYVNLEEGDLLQIEGEESEYDSVYLSKWED